MLSPEQKKFIIQLPKADIGVRFNSAVPWSLMIKTARRRHGRLPYDTSEDMQAWVIKNRNAYELRTALLSAGCQTEQDYFDIILELGRRAKAMNVISRELYVDFAGEQRRGIPLEIVMEGCLSGKNAAAKKHGVHITFFAEINAPSSPENMMACMLSLRGYGGLVEGICLRALPDWQNCADYGKCFSAARDYGLYRSFDAYGLQGIKLWNVVELLQVDRLESPAIGEDDNDMLYCLADKHISCAFRCGDMVSQKNTAAWLEALFSTGVACMLVAPAPEYEGNLLQEYAQVLIQGGLNEEQLAHLAYNSLCHAATAKLRNDTFHDWLKGLPDLYNSLAKDGIMQ